MSREALERQRPQHRPSLGSRGLAARTVLQLVADGRTLESIEAETFRSYPNLFRADRRWDWHHLNRRGAEEFSRALADAFAGLADMFVLDAFGSAHRAHASTVGVAERLPAAAGRLLEAEILAFCKERLAGFKAPKRVVFTEIPKTSTGKIQKFKLREKEWAGRNRMVN